MQSILHFDHNYVYVLIFLFVNFESRPNIIHLSQRF